MPKTFIPSWNPWNPIDPKTGKTATTEAAKLRAQAEDRRRMIEALGWEPEGSTAGDRYAARSSELRAYLRAAGFQILEAAS